MASPKFSKKIDARGWMIWVLCNVYAVLREHLTKISFGLKINLAMLQVTWSFNILHQYGPKLEKKSLLEILPFGTCIYEGLKTAKNGVLGPS